MTLNSSQRRRRSTSSPTGAVPIPSTLWALDADRLDWTQRWPEPILSRAVHEFSAPGSRVLLIGWPAPSARGSLRVIEPDTATALAAIRDMDRDGTDRVGDTGAPVDLVIASLLADHHDSISAAEHVTALAIEAMEMGAVLVVLSRCRHSEHGTLLDPAGPVIHCAQAADLLYLQHIIAAPVTGHTITAAPRASGIPRHTVAHTDVVVFLQPEHG
ncbi:hypothetical protein [Nocardia brasiliensis]|uniref:hypothetical protein n=1 Tax=Nocardia brasiliensis TaxID=37326 RepID=UPI0033E34499